VTDLADPLEPGPEPANDLRRKAAAARAEAGAPLAKAEQRMSEALALERRVAEHAAPLHERSLTARSGPVHPASEHWPP
jgi:hypothetical protein